MERCPNRQRYETPGVFLASKQKVISRHVWLGLTALVPLINNVTLGKCIVIVIGIYEYSSVKSPQ